VQHLSAVLDNTAVADGSDEAALRSLGVEQFDAAIVAIANGTLDSIMATLALKRLGVGRVIARAKDDRHGEVLQRIGANAVIHPERDMGRQLAHSYMSAGVLDHIEVSADYGVSKVPLPVRLIGRTAARADLRSRWDLHLLMIQRGDRMIIRPSETEPLLAGDVLVLAGTDERVTEFLDGCG
jgi:trk system potassium uptake protein